jgi:hypothetical protein
MSAALSSFLYVVVCFALIALAGALGAFGFGLFGPPGAAAGVGAGLFIICWAICWALSA